MNPLRQPPCWWLVLLVVLAALPLTFFLAALPRNGKLLGLMLLLIPFWTNMLIRTYAWQVLLSSNSWFSKAAVALGLLESGEGLYPSAFAVFLVVTAWVIALRVAE